ncbi:hypothetical protein GCM10023185_46070 [Hymenobacter saemangeumensis]|uniref:NTPase n=1 Tax=Hymenobacter saemangeumensis TaxID=1084522 RepID=A0ABP8ISS3_9BACT
MPAIYLLTGPIRSGKTTRLMAWARATPGAAGLLMPDGPQGRMFHDLETGFAWPAAARLGEARPLTIGRFQFSRAAFEWANASLRGAAARPGTRWLVLDELGPLELRGEGLAPALQSILAQPARPFHLVLVIRASLVGQVTAAFNLSRWPLRPFHP